MTFDILQPVLDWTHAHPDWTELAVFGVAFGESLVVIGLLFPGIFLFVLRRCVGGAGRAGSMDDAGPARPWARHWATASASGSVATIISACARCGRCAAIPNCSTGALRNFNKHGGKSVLLGRFIGPLRPFIPAVAGMLDMPRMAVCRHQYHRSVGVGAALYSARRSVRCVA